MAHQGVSPVLFESVSNVTATNSVDLGTRVVVDGRQYVYVYNGAANSVISPGNGVIVQTGSSGYTVTISSVTSVDAFAAVCYHSTIATGYYGWLVARGHTKYKMVADSGATACDILFAGANGLFSVCNTALVAQFCMGKAVAATGSGGVGEAFVNCLYGV